jgi:hypothetical protein
VWWYPGALANILSLAHVRQKNLVEYVMLGVDKPKFIVNKEDGTVREIVETDTGLYVSDGLRGTSSGVALVNTVANNCTNYTHNDYLYLLGLGHNNRATEYKGFYSDCDKQSVAELSSDSSQHLGGRTYIWSRCGFT